MRVSAPALPPWFTSDLRWITASRAARSLSQGYLIVILPLYLLQIGFNGVSLGELFTAGALISAFLTVSVSLLADQVGRKPFLIVFPIFTAIGALVMVFTGNFWVIVAACAFGTLGRGGGAGGAGSGGPFYPAQQALIADHSSAVDRNKVFSAFSFTDSIGSTTGALLASVPDLLSTHLHYSAADSYKPLFVLTSVLAVVMLVTILPVRETVRRAAKNGPRRAILPRQSRNVIGRLAVTNLVNGLGVGFFSPFLSYWLYRRFGASPGTIGLLFAAVNLGAAIPYLAAPALARKLGVVRAVVGVRLIGVALLAVLPWMPSFLLAGAVYFVRMSFQRASIPLRQSYSMGVVSKEERSAAAGLSNLPSQLSASISPLAAGYIFETISLELPFEIGAVFQLLNAALFFSLFRGIRPPEETPLVEQPASGELR
ncbi:MAG: MFS transporter [Chloroflexota bacterium]